MGTNKTCRIFLASSVDEMQQQRLEFGDFIRKLSDIYRPRGVDITVVKCEDLRLAYSGRPLEEELHDEVRKCDVFVALFHKQCGKWTVEEFDVACESFAANKKPIVIVAIQDAKTRTPKLESFINKVDKDKGIFHWRFDTKEKLHFNFVMWFLQSEFAVGDSLTVENGTVKIGDLTVAQFSQLPFAANNEEYQRLESSLKSLNEDIEQIRQDIQDYPDNTKFPERLSKKVMERDKIQEKLEIQQDAFLGASRKIAGMQKQQVSKKLHDAIDAFEAGQLDVANTYLDELQREGGQLFQEIYSMHEELKTKENQIQDHIETLRLQMHDHIEALRLQTQTVMADTNINISERIARVAGIYAKADDWANRSAYDKVKYAKLLFDYASFLNNYAHYDEAEKIYLRQIALSEELYGKYSTDTATSYNSIGKVYNNQGEYSKALEYSFMALDFREKVLGTDHSETAESYNNIGTVYDNQGEYDKALEYDFKALAIREKVLGTDHPDTAMDYNNIGLVYYNQGDYSKALEYSFMALEIHEKVLGTDHPETAKDYNNIGLVYYNQGNYGQAQEYHFKALAIHEKVLGKYHPSTATSYDNIGKTYYELGEYKEALEFFNRALDIREIVFGKNGLDTGKSYNNIGTVYYSIGDYDKALEYLFKALDIIKQFLGKDHPDTASTFNNIGLVYKVQGNNDKALEYYIKALDIWNHVLGENNPNTASSYNNIGGIYYSLGDYDLALEYYKKALHIHEQVLGKNHPDTASSYNNLGVLYLELGDLDKALEYYNSALDIRERVLGKDNINTAQSYNNMGTICYRQGKYSKALEFFNKALTVFTKKLGKNHPLTAVVYNSIGEVYNNQRDINKAREFYSKSLPIIEKQLDIDNSNQNKTDGKDKEIDFQKNRSIVDQNSFTIINDITNCIAALSDVNNYFDFHKELRTLAKDLRIIFKSEYCAIGIVDGTVAEDYVVSLESHDEEGLQKLQSEYLESVRSVDISNKNILLCRALEQKSSNIVYFDQNDTSKSENFAKFILIMKSGIVVNNTVIPLRDDYKQNIGYLQFLNSKDYIDFHSISPLLTALLGLARIILQRNIKQRSENREIDFDFYTRIQHTNDADELLNDIMKYLAKEFNAAIVSFRIPIANAPQEKLSHFYLRSCYVNNKIKNHDIIKSYYHKYRILIPKDKMGSYKDLRRVRKGQVIYHYVKDTSLNNKFNLDLYDKFITLPIFRDDTTNKSPYIKQLFGVFQLRLFKPSSTNKKTELLSRIRFERELVDAKKRLVNLSEQTTLLINSFVRQFENESLQTFQKKLRNSSFVKIQDFDERCVNIIKESVRANECSIYRFDNQNKQLILSATSAKTIHFNDDDKNLDANINKKKCFIPISSNNNILVKAFTDKSPMYIYNIRDPKAHQSSFIENIDSGSNQSNLSAMVVPLKKKDGECLGLVLLLGRKNSNRFISTAYWEHDIRVIEFIINTLSRISESDNERMTFLSQLSHELLSPVTELVYDNDYIINLAVLNPKSITKHQLISKLRDNIDKCMLLKYIITDTEFRYATSGRSLDYNIVKQDRPQDTILEAIRLLEKEAHDKNLTIVTDISKMSPIYFDKERMMQVFLNLLKNAIRYSYNYTTITISYNFENNFHEIIFANDGIGVQKEEKETIFELFNRGIEAKIKSEHGTGIGLYIVRDIMKAHDGDCFVRKLCSPTEFVITLPNK